MKDNPTRTDSRLANLGSVLANWRDWNLPVKLAAVTLVPVIFAIVLGAMQIADQVDRASSYRQVDRLVLANEELRTLVTALQRERTASAMLLAERFTEMATELSDERRAVDGALDEFTRAADRVRFGEDVTADRYRDVEAWLGELRGLREQVSGSLIDASTVLSRYTSVIEALLRFDRALAAEMIDPHLVSTSAAQHELETIAEQVQFQHALVGVGIVRGGLVGPDLESLRSSLASFEDSVASFRAVADAQYTKDFDRAITEPVSAGRTNLAGAVAASQPGAGIPTTVVDWYASSDAAQRGITAVADQLGQKVRERSTALQDEASDGAGLASVILLVALVVAIAVMIVVGRHLVSSLGVLRRSALEVAEQRLPEAVALIREHGGDGAAIELEPVPVTSMDEVGQVARAFDAVQSQALRLATEQAGLRARYSSVFVNLSRRSQGLVQRQLHLLERLERDEEDADQLATLFQLDHLATRMRRNNENLMVLSGSDVSRRNQRPATLADLLRAAVSEIEQYQRVVMLPPPDALVVGYAVGDLVRLTAELLDNATSFSAPDTNVTIASHSFDDGSVGVSVHDEGIGMNQEELDEANGKLADTTSIDVSTSRRMGLFVIGRLAGRHGIEVRLNGGPDATGVRAMVTVPAELIAQASETPRSAPATPAALPTALPSGGLVPFSPSVNGHGTAVNGSNGGSHSGTNGGSNGGTNGGAPGSAGRRASGSTNGGLHRSTNGGHRGGTNGAQGTTNGGKLPRRRSRPVNGSGNHDSGKGSASNGASGNVSTGGGAPDGDGSQDPDLSPTVNLPALTDLPPTPEQASTGVGENGVGGNGTRRRRSAARRPVGDGPDPVPDPTAGPVRPPATRTDDHTPALPATTSDGPDVTDEWPETDEPNAAPDDGRVNGTRPGTRLPVRNNGNTHDGVPRAATGSTWDGPARNGADGPGPATRAGAAERNGNGGATGAGNGAGYGGATGSGYGSGNGAGYCSANGAGNGGATGAGKGSGNGAGNGGGNGAGNGAGNRNPATRNGVADRPGHGNPHRNATPANARRTAPGADPTRPDGERAALPRRSPGRGGRNRPDVTRPHTPFTPAGGHVSPADGLFFSPGGRGAGEHPPPAGAPRAPRPHPRRTSAGGPPQSLFAPWGPTGPPPAAPPRRLDETTPIFDEMVSVWFRTDPPATEPAPPPAETPGRPWRFDADAGFDVARAASRAEPVEYTDNGLPRRNPRQNLVPGSVAGQKGSVSGQKGAVPGQKGAPSPARPGKAAEDMRERLSNYHYGVRRARDHGGGPVEWHFAADGGWRAANAVSSAKPVEFTPGGLPRRTPLDHLLPGSVPPASPDGQPRAERAEELRGRLGSFQQGLSRGRRNVADRPGGNGIRENEQQERE